MMLNTLPPEQSTKGAPTGPAFSTHCPVPARDERGMRAMSRTGATKSAIRRGMRPPGGWPALGTLPSSSSRASGFLLPRWWLARALLLEPRRRRIDLLQRLHDLVARGLRLVGQSGHILDPPLLHQDRDQNLVVVDAKIV